MQEPEDWELELYHILHHPRRFMEFFTPVDARGTKVLPFADWMTADHWGQVRLYQYPSLPWDHLLPEDTPIVGTKVPGYTGVDRKQIGEAYNFGGRKTSKSFDLVHDIVQSAPIHDGEGTMLTTRDDNHLKQRADQVWNYAEQHPFFAPLVVSSTKGDPYPQIVWYNGHRTEAIIESTTGRGDNYLGHHRERVCIDEFQLSSMEAWIKLQDATAEEGCVIRTTGVSDGRLATPAHMIRNSPEYETYLYIRPQYLNERWTPESRRKAIKNYGGEDSHDYRTNVDAEEGDPMQDVWKIIDILACMEFPPEDKRKPLEKRRPILCPVVEVNGSNVDRIGPEQFPQAWSPSLPVWMSMDVGGRPDPSILAIWGMEPVDGDYIPHLWGVFKMLGVSYPRQAEFVLDVGAYYGAQRFGIDHTGTDGVSVMQNWAGVENIWKYRIHVELWDSRTYIEIPLILEADDDWTTDDKPKYKKLDPKHYMTTLLYNRFAERRISMLYWERAMLEFGGEVRHASSGRYSAKEWIYRGTQGDHFIDATRILEYMIFMAVGKETETLSAPPSIWQSSFIPLGTL